MGGTTPKFALPYPTGTDRVADGDNAIQALAEKVETTISSPFFLGKVPSGVSVTVGGNIGFTAIIDSHSKWVTPKYFIPVAGIYRLTHGFKINSGISAYPIHQFTSSVKGIIWHGHTASNNAYQGGQAAWVGRCVVNEELMVNNQGPTYTAFEDGVNATNNYICIEWLRD